MTSPKTSERNLPKLNVTVDRWMDNWLRQMADTSGLGRSRILREIIATAHRNGYTPGHVNIGSLEYQSQMRNPR